MAMLTYVRESSKPSSLQNQILTTAPSQKRFIVDHNDEAEVEATKKSLAKIFEERRESETNKSKHLPLAFVKETAIKGASQSPTEKMRQDMEEIYLQTFRINLLKDSKEIIDEFMHVLHEDTLCVQLAAELIESDLMKDWEMDCLYQRVAIW